MLVADGNVNAGVCAFLLCSLLARLVDAGAGFRRADGSPSAKVEIDRDGILSC